jgi:hypothetical protein
MSAPLLPIYRDIRHLMVQTENRLRKFSCYHNYAVGTDLRQQAMAMICGVCSSCYVRERMVEHVRALVWLLDDYKLTLQWAMELGTVKYPNDRSHHLPAFLI